jgi:hypothetical protein
LRGYARPWEYVVDERSGCAEARELLPELAAGVAAGDERARAYGHLSECVDCRRELDELAIVVDELLTLVPAVEPPRGFESAVLARINPPARRWWQRGMVRGAAAVALAVVAVVAGVGIAMQATAEDRRVAEAYRRTLQITGGRFLTARPLTTPDGAAHGRVFAYQGKDAPSWIIVLVQNLDASGAYRVHLLTRDGRDRDIGEVTVSGGQGSWGVAIDVDVAEIAQVTLSGPAGPPLTAAFLS